MKTRGRLAMYNYVKFLLSKTLLPLLFCILLIPSGVKAQSIDIDPALMERFNLTTEDGQIVVEVSLPNLLLLALERATTMDIVRINQKIATEIYEATKEMYNPNFSTTLGIQRVISPTGTNMSGDVISVYTKSTAAFLSLQAVDTSALKATWSKKLKSGILYSLSYQKASSLTNTGSYAKENDEFSGWDKYDDPLYTDTMTAAVSVPIFQDWGDINKAPEYKSQIGLESTEYESQKAVVQMLEVVAGIYWDMVGVDENIQTLKASEELSQQFVNDTKTRVELGVLDPIEVKQGESQLLLVQQNLLNENFQKKQIEDQIKVALNLQDIPYGYKPTEKMKQRSEEIDFNRVLDEAYKNSQDLSLLESQLKLNGIQLKEAYNKAKTNLDLSLEYNFNGYGKDLTGSTTNTSETKLHDYQIGLTWNVPLFDKQTPQIIHQRTMENERLMLQMSNLKAQLKVQLQSILRSLKLAEQAIKLTTTSVELAKDLLEKETEKFNLGNNTSFRVAQVQQDLTDAKKNKTIAQVNYEKAYLKLLTITGKIYKEYGLPVFK